MKENDSDILVFPIEEDGRYCALVKFLENKNTTGAQKLLAKLKTLKTNEDFGYFENYLLFELFVEFYQNAE